MVHDVQVVLVFATSTPAFSSGLLSSAMCTQVHDNEKCQFRVLKICSVCVKIKLSIVDYY